MDFAGYHYYDINRRLLSSIGLWPYENSVFKRVLRVVVFSLLVFFFLAQLAELLIEEQSILLFSDVLSTAVPITVFAAKYILYWARSDAVKELMNKVQCDWNMLKQEMDFKIIREYAYMTRRFTLIFALFIYVLLCSFGFLQSLPCILHAIGIRNESSPEDFPLTGYFIVDPNEYFFYLAFPLIVVSFYGVNILVATMTIYLAYVQHACGMFKIASYRMHCAFDEYQKERQQDSQLDEIVCANVITAIKIHKRAIESLSISARFLRRFFEFLNNTFRFSYLPLLALAVASLSVHIFQFVHLMHIEEKRAQFIASALILLGDILYIFCGNLACQRLMDHSRDIFIKTYTSKWYMAPLRAQKMVLFVMQRSVKDCALIISCIFVPSLEGFASLVSMSTSYFMVFSSIQ